VFALSDRARARPVSALAALALWALINGSLVASGFSEWPLISLISGLAGACAIVTTGTLLARAHWLNFLRFCGEHSIVIYLAFFLPMAVTRTLLLRTGFIPDIGVMSLIVTVVRARSAGDLAACAQGRRKVPVRTPRRVLDRAEKGKPRIASGRVGLRTRSKMSSPGLTGRRSIPEPSVMNR
jgi:hypothetical protein